MIIATIPDITMRGIRIPEYAHRCALNNDGNIGTTSTGVLHGADEWAACLDVWPHIDPSWRGQLFLTLSVQSNHYFGDTRMRIDRGEACMHVPCGTLFVVDPMTPHWLTHASGVLTDEHDTERTLWIGLQWIVSRQNACAKARAIVDRLDGRWAAQIDARYRRWAPNAAAPALIEHVNGVAS